MKSVIIGASGLVGSLLLTKLLNDPSLTQVLSIGRKQLSLEHKKLHQLKISDLNEILLHKDQLQADLYFCCLGTTIKQAGSQENFKKVDYQAVLDFGKIAELHQAQSLAVITAAGADAKSALFYNQVKGEVEVELRKLKISQLILFHPGLLVGDRKEFRATEKFAIGSARFMSHLLPKQLMNRFVTPAELVADKMLQYSKIKNSGTVILEPLDISRP